MSDEEYLNVDWKVWCVVHCAIALVAAGFATWLLLQEDVSVLLKTGCGVPACLLTI